MDLSSSLVCIEMISYYFSSDWSLSDKKIHINISSSCWELIILTQGSSCTFEAHFEWTHCCIMELLRAGHWYLARALIHAREQYACALRMCYALFDIVFVLGGKFRLLSDKLDFQKL